MKLPIYMDYHATTPVDKRVLEAMLPTFGESFGNASSRNHSFGWEAERLVEKAREQAASLIGAEPEEIVFTSGATESINLALKGVAYMYRERGRHIITSVTEHKAVLDSAKSLEREGFEVTYLPVEKDGRLSLDLFQKTIQKNTILVAIMHGNNEVGTLQPVEEIGHITREKGVLFFCDAAQTIGKIPFDVNQFNVDLTCVSGHKIYGPKGVGMLYVRRKKPRVRLAPIIDGGGHERGLRSGTLNVSGIVGLGKACELAGEAMEEEARRIRTLRDRLLKRITENLDEVYVNGGMENRLPNNLSLSFRYVEGESLLSGVGEEIAVSSGSACTSATLEPSYVLKSLGVGEDLLHTSIRFGLGRFTTEEEVDYTAKRVVETVKSLRSLSPLYAMAKGDTDSMRLPADSKRQVGIRVG